MTPPQLLMVFVRMCPSYVLNKHSSEMVCYYLAHTQHSRSTVFTICVTNHFNIAYRLGGGPSDYKDVMNHEFFKSINFDDILAKKVRAM